MRSNIPSFDVTRARLARALPGVAPGRHTTLHSSPGPALEEIHGLAAAGRIAYIARARDPAHRVQARDIRHALSTAPACHLQANGRWRVEGADLSGTELQVVVAITRGVLVVTVS